MQDQLPLLITDYEVGFDDVSLRGECMFFYLLDLLDLIYESWQSTAVLDNYEGRQVVYPS